ncbi:hypothetical protein VKT23_002148 [Stygiomarasmius scandens]|uniref:WIBG Mago-binding domain-containing protein n=1 Tax=Marasmiellus scandens TaxID=2682957 RepID=A0ABR1K143_9AGAR
MSKPAIDPKKTTAGITVDPHTLERVVPESRRADGSVRKQLKIRPGFTPQEDVSRFRGTRQAQMDASALPKGHILGWVAPTAQKEGQGSKPMSKSAKKNAKRKEKREEKKNEVIKDSWEDEDEDVGTPSKAQESKASTPSEPAPSAGAAEPLSSSKSDAESLSKDMDKLQVR